MTVRKMSMPLVVLFLGNIATAEHWTDGHGSWFAHSAEVSRPNGGSLVDSDSLLVDEDNGLSVEYRVFRVPWDGRDALFVQPCESDDPTVDGRMPELWRFETHVSNRSTGNTIHFNSFPSVDVRYGTGTSLREACRNWGTNSFEAFQNDSYIEDGDVWDLFSPYVLSPSDEGVSVRYAASVGPHKYGLMEWQVGSYVVEREGDGTANSAKTAAVDRELADYLRERSALDAQQERERQLAAARLAERHAKEAERRRQESDERARQARREDSDNSGQLIGALLGTAAIVGIGIEAEMDADVVAESAAAFVDQVLDEPDNREATPGGTTRTTDPLGSPVGAANGGSKSMADALRNLEAECGERYRGPPLDDMNIQTNSFCGMAFMYQCNIKMGDTSDQAKEAYRVSCGRYDALRSRGRSCPHCP